MKPLLLVMVFGSVLGIQCLNSETSFSTVATSKTIIRCAKTSAWFDPRAQISRRYGSTLGGYAKRLDHYVGKQTYRSFLERVGESVCKGRGVEMKAVRLTAT